MVGNAKKHSEYKWENWNGENTAHALHSDDICGACAYMRAATGAGGGLKLNHGFIASVSTGFIPFIEKEDIISNLANLPEPPFVLTIVATYTRTSYPFMLPVSYSADPARAGLLMGGKRKFNIRSGTPGKYAKISPPAEENYIIDIRPAELLDAIDKIKESVEDIYTREARDIGLADPYWALVFWLAGVEDYKLYRTMPKYRKGINND